MKVRALPHMRAWPRRGLSRRPGSRTLHGGNPLGPVIVLTFAVPMTTRLHARSAAALLGLLLVFAGTAKAEEPPLPSPLLAAEAIDASGGRVALSPSTEAIVDPASTFRVVLPGRSEDARLSVLDLRDDLLPSRGTREVGVETVLTVTPVQPLTPASHYLLRVDGARSRDLHDSAQRAAGPVELRVVAAGVPPEPEKKPAKKKRRR